MESSGLLLVPGLSDFGTLGLWDFGTVGLWDLRTSRLIAVIIGENKSGAQDGAWFFRLGKQYLAQLHTVVAISRQGIGSL